MPTTPQYFERDPNAGAHLAAAFGQGAGNAEHLVEANLLRFSEQLLTANDLPLDVQATADLDRADVASAAGVDPKALLDYAVRGEDYVTFVAMAPDGRTYKGVLERDGDSLDLVGEDDDPRRVQMRAQIAAAKQVQEAQAEAARIVQEAQEKAAEIVADAAKEGHENAAQETADAAERARKAEEEGNGDGDGKDDADEEAGGTTRAQRTRARQGSSSQQSAKAKDQGATK